MKNIFTRMMATLLLFSAIVNWAQAEEIQLREDHPDEYIVVKGDTLWDISETFLKNPWMWPELWHANPQIDNPHLIFPGDVISLIYLDGRPRLTISRRTEKLQPGVTKLSPAVRVVPLADAIPAIPLDVIDAFLNKNRIVDKREMEAAPYVVAGEEQRLILANGDRLYARGALDSSITNYNLYRLGQPYVDPKTKEVLGYQGLDIGSVRVTAANSDVSTLAVTRSTEEVRIGDRLLPDEERAIESTFFPSAPANEAIEGLVLAMDQGLTHAGAMDVVVINLGEREGIEAGDVLAIYKEGKLIKDTVAGGKVQLPEEKAGLLMVFRTFEKLSFGLILESSVPVNLNDKLYSPASTH
ncbi:LysM peptidoglycan-binding domain-containing protein [Halioxenophilus sp. WMMB6]|uniref:LysM peptidoglycan-binding domain-containing protein n=1 Tax=Halioxenophilus sp. WMMB6 TaxID=3073815 RepID=UPI00295E447D|nr:LysM peptidoglycan-binding domain-containing protein [Halioxenophilus sp. WMMB6]